MVDAAAVNGRALLRVGVWGRTAAALLALSLLLPLAEVGTTPLLFGSAVTACAAYRPRATLLWVAALCPIAPIVLAAFFRWPASIVDAIVVAFLAGACLRRVVERRASNQPAFAGAVVAVAAVVVASLAVQAALAGVLVTPAGLPTYLAGVWRTLYERPGIMPSAIAATQTLTALAVGAFAASWSVDAAFRTKLLRVSVIGGVAGALLAVARILQIALRTEAPLAALPHVLRTVRVSGPFSDPNAAGSYFLLLLVPAAAATAQTRGSRRAAWWLASTMLAFGIWTSGSRAAVLIGLACLGTAVIVAAFRARRWRYPISGVVILVSTAVVSLFPNPILDRSMTSAVGIRAEMARVALRMWETDPWIGVGVGTFYDRSGEFVRDDYVKELYGRENAHNNFLQVLAELGLIGAAAFGLLLWTASPPARDVDAISLGVGAFLATCLAGHPLLLPTVAVPFWILVGAAAGRNALHHERRPWLTSAIVACTALAIVPSYFTERAVMNLEHAGSGMSSWQRTPDGAHFRTMRGKSRIFAPRPAGQVSFALRAAAPASAPVVLSIAIEGRPADRVVLSNDWTVERLRMPDHPEYAFLALDLEALDAQHEPAAVDVGKVEPLGGR